MIQVKLDPGDDEPVPLWQSVLLVALIVAVGVTVVLTLRPPRCADGWTYALPGTSGACPVGGYVAEHPPIGGGALVVCRCRPEPRTYQPESRP